MRSRSSANAFLVRYICDLTRFNKVAKSIGRVITKAGNWVSCFSVYIERRYWLTCVVIRGLMLLNLVQESRGMLLSKRISIAQSVRFLPEAIDTPVE